MSPRLFRSLAAAAVLGAAGAYAAVWYRRYRHIMELKMAIADFREGIPEDRYPVEVLDLDAMTAFDEIIEFQLDWDENMGDDDNRARFGGQ